MERGIYHEGNTLKKGSTHIRVNPLYFLVGRARIELATNGLKVRCSTI